MAPALTAFIISTLMFGGYAATSAFAVGWKPDVWLLGFAIYGGMFGFSSFMTSLLAQIICKHFPAPTVLATGIAGVI